MIGLAHLLVVLYWVRFLGEAFLKIFMTAGIHILICWAFFFQQKLASAFSTQWPEGVNCRYCFIVLTTILVVRVAGCIELEKATLGLGWGRFSTRKKKMAGILVPRKLGRNRCLDLRHCTLKLVFYLEKRHAFSLLQNRPAIICLQNLSKVFVFWALISSLKRIS